MKRWDLQCYNLCFMITILCFGVVGSLAEATDDVGQLYQFTYGAATALDNSLEVMDARRVEVEKMGSR